MKKLLLKIRCKAFSFKRSIFIVFNQNTPVFILVVGSSCFNISITEDWGMQLNVSNMLTDFESRFSSSCSDAVYGISW